MVNSQTVISQAQITQGMPLAQIGGKAAGLGRLLAAGAQVPPFFVLAPDWSPGIDSAALKEALTTLGEGPWAVRSSAVAEDGASTSFAGQLQTVLGLCTQAQVLTAVQTCRDSATSDTVQAYCKIHGIQPGPVAVIIQRMIVGEASGVAFSRDPQDPGFVLISAAWGLGEGVVQGQVNCDTYRVDPQGGMLGEVEIKPSCMRLVDGEVREVPVPEADQHTAVLDEAQIFELGLWCRSLEAQMDFPQDVEWTISEGKLYLLQTRPITVPIPWGHRMLWDNSNIVESFSGTTTPLTFSFARNAYAIVYQLFCRVMGVKEAVISENGNSFRRMIGLIKGRVYYNLNAWYRVVAMLPGYRFNREAMEQMMGVSEAADDEDAHAQDASWQERVLLTPKMIGLVISILWRGARRNADCERFEREFEQAYRPWREADLNAMNPDELMFAYADLERKLLWNWTAPLINDWFTMIHHGRLTKRCVDWVGEPEESDLANALLAGEGDLESTAPTRELLGESARIRLDKDLCALFASEKSDSEVHAIAMKTASFSAFFEDYLAVWGDRCVDELKLETVPLKARPEFLIRTLRNYLAGPPVDPSGFGQAEKASREVAESLVHQRLGVFKRWRFMKGVRKARACVAKRESLRFLRTRVFALVRDIFRSLGDQMAAANTLRTPEDIFFLHIEEVWGWVDGSAVSVDLQGLVQARKAEFATYDKAPPPPERFYTYGPVHRHNAFIGEHLVADIDEDGRIRGTPCFPGLVEESVAIRHDPGDGLSLSGQILAAPRTDPGWVPLFPSISGLLVERGSLLSHSAVVAREMGIPTIVGLRGITDMLQDGERIRMDGRAGTVERLHDQSEE
jgi:phosphohistidine swiveling domain-containing protein